MQTKRNASQTCGCAVGAAMMLGMFGLFGYLGLRDRGFLIALGVMVGVVLLGAIVVVTRRRLAQSYYDVIVPDTGEPLRLGGRVTWTPAVQCKKQCKMGVPTLTLTCKEHAINRGGTSDSHYYNDAYKQQFTLGEPRTMHSGEIAELGLRAELPATGIPSFHGSNNTIEWQAVLRVPMAGMVPDILRETRFWCLPEIAGGADRAVSSRDAVPAGWVAKVGEPKARAEHGSVSAEISSRDAATVGQYYAVAAGDTLRLRVTVQTSKDIHCRGVLCWAGCRVHGAGTPDEIVVTNWFPLQEGDFRAGFALTRDLDVAIPASGPVSYQGKYVKIDWMVRVRVDVPVWRDVWLELPFIVTPRLAEASS